MKKEISQPIVKPTTLKSGHTYVITAPVTVAARLTIECDVTIYIRNDNSSANGLTFSSSSELIAEEVNFFACDDKNEKVNEAQNGGLTFNGTIGPNGTGNNYNTNASNFVAKKIRCNYLGGFGATSVEGSGASALTINNCNNDEWNIDSVSISYSGGNGVTINESQVEFDFLSIQFPSADGLSVENSTLTINKGLKIKNGDSGVLIHMEADQNDVTNPLCYVKIPNHTKVYLDGPWDVTDVKIVSKALPEPTPDYYYRDCTSCGQTYVFPA